MCAPLPCHVPGARRWCNGGVFISIALHWPAAGGRAESRAAVVVIGWGGSSRDAAQGGSWREDSSAHLQEDVCRRLVGVERHGGGAQASANSAIVWQMTTDDMQPPGGEGQLCALGPRWWDGRYSRSIAAVNYCISIFQYFNNIFSFRALRLPSACRRSAEVLGEGGERWW